MPQVNLWDQDSNGSTSGSSAWGKFPITHPLSFVLNFTLNSIIIMAIKYLPVSTRFTK